MGRVRTFLETDGRKCWTLFDSGARNTYVVDNCVGNLTKTLLPQAQPVALGGHIHQVGAECIVVGKVEGYPVSVKARIVPEIGLDEDKRPIELLFGALAMQEWGIKLDVANERLDMSCYPKEFVEF